MATRSTSLPASPASPAAARGFLRRAIADCGLRVDVDDAVVALSEIASNVVRHAGTPMRIDVDAGAVLHVAVTDQRPDLAIPADRPNELRATWGRGLHLLDSLASRWGETRARGAKTVWFEMDPISPATGPSALADHRAGLPR
jgi:sigma-B regulation protein RsbU (phosphoserine phosphatase)